MTMRRGDPDFGGKKWPEAIAWGDQDKNRKGSDTSFPMAVDGAGTATSGETPGAAKEAEDKKVTAAIPEPEPDSRENTLPEPTAAHTHERPENLGVAGGPRQGRAAGTSGASTRGQDRQPTLKGSVSTTAAASESGDGDGGVVAPPSPNLVEPNPGEPAKAYGVGKVNATTVAPAGSLVRLKRRRQQARTRSDSQR